MTPYTDEAIEQLIAQVNDPMLMKLPHAPSKQQLSEALAFCLREMQDMRARVQSLAVEVGMFRLGAK